MNDGSCTQDVDIEFECHIQKAGSIPPEFPDDTFLQICVKKALVSKPQSAEITLRFVEKEESASLNDSYRRKQTPTNVLSFPLHEHPEHILGDVVVCIPVVIEECHAYKQSLFERLAHLIIHGTLHLQGYDHMTDEEARHMEALESHIMLDLNMNDPWQGEET